MPHEIDWRPTAIEDVRALFEYLAEHAVGDEVFSESG